MLKNRINNFAKRFALQFLSNCSRLAKSTWNVNDDEKINWFNSNIIATKYSIVFETIPKSDCKHKWVGGQVYGNQLVFIPSDETCVLKKSIKWDKVGELPSDVFKWTGGCVWKNSVYAFPRSANSFLRIGQSVEEVPLTFTYSSEHHYSGVCTKDGIIYQPPRNTSHILKTDLKSGLSEKINIISEKWRIKLRYCGSIIHPNGFVYFFPEKNGKVIKLDPNTDKWCFVGKNISTMCFDAKVGLDGNIYGYSAYQAGIMMIDVKSDCVKMIHTEIKPGAYGTKYGLDGCLYSVPGDGDKIWKYDVTNDVIKEVYDLHDMSKAKYAGGITLQDGTIVCVPVTASSILKLVPDKAYTISEETFDAFCKDNY